MKEKQHAFVVKCVDDHWDDIIEAIENGHGYAATTIDAVCGWVEIVSGRRGYSSVTVHHEDEENQRKCPRLCEAIEKALPSWAEVKEFYDSDDEEEEADNDFGPSFSSFSSWDDYWRYIFREELED